MMVASIRVTGIEKTQQTLKNISEDLRRGNEMHEAVTRGLMAIRNSARDLAPRDTGRLRDSIKFSLSVGVNGIGGRVYSDLPYAAPMEKGTRPFFPPPDALIGWVRRKVMGAYRPGRGVVRHMDENTVRGVAFIIAHSISKRGLTGRWYLKRAKERNERTVANYINCAVKRIIHTRSR
jgi:hypothetical protein